MKKAILMALIAGLLALGGGGYWYFFAREGASSTPTGENGSFTGSLADALKVGAAMKCTWSFEGDSSVFYIKSQKMSADITPKNGPKTEMILRDNCTYIWQEGEKQGIKSCSTPQEGEDYDFSEVASASGGTAEALGAQYSCQPTVITDAQFSLPSEVEFLDLNQYLQQFAQ